MDIDALRAQTPGCARRIHLNNAGAALMAQPTLDAMISHLRLEAEIGGYEAAAAAQDAVAATYGAIARLAGGRRDEVALFDNATHAWNAAFYSVPLGPGDRILTGRAEYGSNVLAYLQVAKRTGAEVVVVPNDAYGQLDVAALAALADERTRLIGVSHVPTSGGLVQPAAEIGRIARECGALFLLDATQSVGQFPVDVETTGCDLLTGTGRKFLRGPRGTGFLWVRTAALERLEPFVAEIRSATWDGHRGFTWAGGARRFESWENSYVNILGLGVAVRQALGLGLGAIGERASALGARLRDQLAALPGCPPTTSAWSAAPSSPPGSRDYRRKRWPRSWGAPVSTSPPPCPRTTRSTPRTGVFTLWSGSPPTSPRSSLAMRSRPDTVGHLTPRTFEPGCSRPRTAAKYRNARDEVPSAAPDLAVASMRTYGRTE
jgi:selenocysteine lyase/cysteine desulfurase